jgi:hypothetical protein
VVGLLDREAIVRHIALMEPEGPTVAREALQVAVGGRADSPGD